ncbi:MAG: hypothetical protein AAF602_12590 [Myxococcota bacterium]
MFKVPLLLVAVSLTVSCSRKSEADPSSGLDPELAAVLETTEDGRPILIQTGSGLGAGVEVGIVYDANLDDPVKRWGECLGQVQACFEASDSTACISAVPRCASNQGGVACCAPSCIDGFDAAIAAGADEPSAIDDTFFAGDCLDGFADQLRAAGVTL